MAPSSVLPYNLPNLKSRTLGLRDILNDEQKLIVCRYVPLAYVFSVAWDKFNQSRYYSIFFFAVEVPEIGNSESLITLFHGDVALHVSRAGLKPHVKA